MTKGRDLIVGGGGGGKGRSPRAAVEAENTLRSKQVAHVIDLIGEGEWEGLIDGPGGIYLNNVQLFTPTTPTGNVRPFDELTDASSPGFTGVWNFSGVSVEFRPGTQGQAAIRTTASAGSSFLVNIDVKQATPVVTSVSNSDYDVAIVQVQVDALYQQNKQNGDILGWFVDLGIDARIPGGSWVMCFTDRIEGKSMSPYVRSYAVDLMAISTRGPWEIRVRRVSKDDADSSQHSVLRFLGVNLKAAEKFRYPNSVLVAMGFDASQFSSVPSRAFDVKMSRCRIPVNYDPITRVYSGAWNGNFKVAWTDNPAWCMYEMATNDRFGLGQYFDETLFDKWTLYTIGQYCDVMVPNGFGGMEPRFTMNVYFQSSEEAITVIQNMAAVFRGIVYYMGGALVAVQDAPSDPVYAFNSANVVDGIFNYAGASGSARHTIAMVAWNNPELQYKQDVEYVEDPTGLLKYGYRPVNISALGCTSRGQAHRLGAWALYVEQYEADVLTFKTAIEATGIRPGNIVQVYDPTRAGVRYGGRFLNVAGQVVTVDAPIDIPVGVYNISYILDDGTLGTNTFTNPSTGPKTQFTLNNSMPVPSIGTIFGMQTSTVLPQLFRVLSISEAENMEYEFTAVAHNPSKYNYIEYNLKLTNRPISGIDFKIPAVTNIRFVENIYAINDETIGIKLSVSWDQIQFALGYKVAWRKGSGNWTNDNLVISHNMTLNPVAEDIYSFRITSVSVIGQNGNMVEVQYEVLGEKAPPPPFDYFLCTVQPDGTRQFDFGYDKTEKPIDFKGARIRYYQGNTSNWDVMTPLENEGFFPFSPLETNRLLSGTYTIAAVAEDRTKHQSTPVFILVTLPDRRLGDILAQFSEADDGWQGAKTSCHLDIASNIIEANDTATWATIPSTWTAWTKWNSSPASPIVYTTPVRDLMSSVAALLDAGIVAKGTNLIELRYSKDNVTWSAWLPASTAFTARYFQVRATITATAQEPIPTISQLAYQIGGKVRQETTNDVIISSLTGANRIGVGDIRIPVIAPFSVITSVTVLAIQDPNPGWTWLLFDKLNTGPHIKVYKNGVLADPAFMDFFLEGY